MRELLDRWMPINASAHGPELDLMNALVHWLMAILFVGWSIYFIIVLIRFRAGRNPKASYTGVKSHFSTYLEGGVLLAEVVLLVGFAIPAWARWVTPHSPQENALVVRVIAEQFNWYVHYAGEDGVFGSTKADGTPLALDGEDPFAADDLLKMNALHLPVNRPVTIRLSSRDVIHSFSLPVMRVKQDAIPGVEIPVHFTPVRTNNGETWQIACAQLCGNSHYDMAGSLVVHPEGGFEKWLAAEMAKKRPAAPAASG